MARTGNVGNHEGKAKTGANKATSEAQTGKGDALMKWSINSLPQPGNDNTEAWAWLMVTRSDATDNIPEDMAPDQLESIRARAAAIDPGHEWLYTTYEDDCLMADDVSSMTARTLKDQHTAAHGCPDPINADALRQRYEQLGRAIEALDKGKA